MKRTTKHLAAAASLAAGLAAWSAFTGVRPAAAADRPEPKAAVQGKPKEPHAADTSPALSVDEAAAKFKVPAGFEVRNFASEPMIKNPVAMTFDGRGRLWVVELLEYPAGAKKGVKGRDCVKILEDTDNDGKADKVTLFADGLSLATAITLGNGGVYVGQAPDLYFYPIIEENGETHAGPRKTVLTGFGLDDRHELLNSFCWGPDGWMYFTGGVFTHSLVRDPENPNDKGLAFDALVGRCNPAKKKVEVFADGISNQWGVDFDRDGNAFVSACVVSHFWHVQPGGIYQRQGGVPTTSKYAYEQLKSINDHDHFRAAYGGVQIYQGNLFPKALQGTAFMGNIHGNCLDHDILKPRGSTFIASDGRASDDTGEWLESNDGWFRPVSEQVGPDGALWVMDWYDKYPCYQNAYAPDLDREKGRVWRIVYVGDDKGKAIGSRPETQMNLDAMDDAGLVGLLSHPNIWQRRTAQKLLEQRNHADSPALVRKLLESGAEHEARMAALWTLGAMDALDAAELDKLAQDADPAVRMWTARFTGETGGIGAAPMARLLKLAADPEPGVRAGVAAAARRLGAGDTAPIISALIKAQGTDKDANLPFMIWMATEQKVAVDAVPMLKAIASDPDAPGAPDLLARAVRRVWDTNDAARIDAAVGFIVELSGRNASMLSAAFKGILDWQKATKQAGPRPEALVKLVVSVSRGGDGGNIELPERARRLAAAWGDAAASEAILARINDPKLSDEERLDAMRFARERKGDAARDVLAALIASDASAPLRLEAIRALADVGAERTPALILPAWTRMPAELRRGASEVLSSKLSWAKALLGAVEKKQVDPSDISLTAIRTLANYKDEGLAAQMKRTIGAYNPSTQQKADLIAAKKLITLNGPVDLDKGHEVMQKQCLTCHTFYGEGKKVGPDLTGVGRSSIDALLSNVIDPNLIIGAGYENHIIDCKDGRLLTGRLIEETDDHIRLAGASGEEVVAKKEIAEQRVETRSVMPEGFEALPDADFRNLIWFVYSPRQDDAQKRMRADIEGTNLVIRAKPPGKTEMVPLISYSMDKARGGYLHPVRDPSGAVILTQDAPGDHPWQHGIFTGLHDVGEGKFDFWSARAPERQRFIRLEDLQEGLDRISFKALSQWTSPDGKPVLDEEQSIAVHALDSADHYLIDFTWTLRAGAAAIPIGRYDFGGFSVRMPTSAVHAYLNSAGQRGAAAANQPAAWCNIDNTYDAGTFGIAVIDHPSNFRHPSKWRIDAQGLINPSPSISGDWKIDANKQMTFRYRLVIHAGAVDAKKLDAESARFAKTP